MNRILVTGAAGFIGGSLLARLVNSNVKVLGVDNYSNYYDSRIKLMHIKSENLASNIERVDISNYDNLKNIYSEFSPDTVVHLAAQGGVRVSQYEPEPYIITNQLGFLNLLKLNNEFSVNKLIYASSSSVYGNETSAPFQEDLISSPPKSLYAASKLVNELMATYYPNLTKGIRIGLRFFTVYGPWGRPDMVVAKLIAAGLLKKEFSLTANLELARDFTYINDVIDTLEDLLTLNTSAFEQSTIFNVSAENPRRLDELIAMLKNLKINVNIKKDITSKLDVNLTHGSTKKLREAGIRIPKTSLEEGLKYTLEWMSKPINKDVLKMIGEAL